MKNVVLILLMAVAIVVQYRIDVHKITRAAIRNGWSATGVTWLPLTRWFTRGRFVRCYRLRYRDGTGRPEERLCLVGGLSGDVLEFSSTEAPFARTTLSRVARWCGTRLGSIVTWSCAGFLLGLFLGTAGAMLLCPTSNIAPAYGILVFAPLGLASGAAFGSLRRIGQG